MNITGLEVAIRIANHTGRVFEIAVLAGRSSFLIGREHALGLVAVEHACCIALGGEHIVVAVYGRCETVDGFVQC